MLAASTAELTFIKGAEASTVRLALISDTHVAADPKDENRKFFPTENLKRIIPEIAASGPSAVIHNGDVARLSGEIADYQAVRSALADLRQVGAQLMGEAPRAQSDRRAFEQRDHLLVLFIELLTQSNEISAGLCAVRELSLHTVHSGDGTVGHANAKGAPCCIGAVDQRDHHGLRHRRHREHRWVGALS